MCGSNYEFGLPANVKDRLLLLVGKEIPLIQNASEAFSSCLSLIDRLVCTLLSAPEQCPATERFFKAQQQRDSGTFSFIRPKASRNLPLTAVAL